MFRYVKDIVNEWGCIEDSEFFESGQIWKMSFYQVWTLIIDSVENVKIIVECVKIEYKKTFL